MSVVTGSAELELGRLAVRYSALIRIVVVTVPSLVSLVTTTARAPLAAVLLIVAFNLWNAFYGLSLLHGRARSWLLPADLVVVSCVCLAQVWTAVPEMRVDRVSWTLVAASIIVVAYQFHTPLLTGALAAVVVLVAYLAGAVLAGQQDLWFAVPIGSWIIVEAALGRGLYLLVRRGGRTADALVARNERIRRETVVADARRNDEREYLAALHDTASATLLMVGAGVAERRESWLAEQAARDLEVIRGHTDPLDGEVDVVAMLRQVVEHVPLRVEWHAPEPVAIPAMVAVALCRGTREALTNVMRHAGVGTAEVSVQREHSAVVVHVRDEGKGFDPDSIVGQGYGVTGSLMDRMARIGGRAIVSSAPGAGTSVRLEWPDDRS